MFVGSTVYIGAFIALGVYGGPTLLSAFETKAFPFRFVLTTIALIASLAVLRVLSRRASDVTRQVFGQRPSDLAADNLPQVADRGWRAPATLSRVDDAINRHVPQNARRTFDASMIAGLGATVMMSLAVSWLLELAAFMLPASPEYALLRFLEWRPDEVKLPISPEAITGFLADQSPMMRGVWTTFGGLLVTIPLQVIGHLIWALVYGFMLERRLSGSPITRGLQFAFGLWIATGVVIYPLVGAGPFGSSLNAGWAPFTAELVRHAAFGTALGVIYNAIQLVLMTRSGGTGTSGTFPAVPKVDTLGDARTTADV
jgi:hypothetical protein